MGIEQLPGALLGVLKQGAANALQTASGFYDMVGGLYGATPGGQIGQSAANSMSSLAKFMGASLNGSDPDTVTLPKELQPPFAGGQCPVAYQWNISIHWTDVSGTGMDYTSGWEGYIIGPIAGVIVEQPTNPYGGVYTYVVAKRSGKPDVVMVTLGSSAIAGSQIVTTQFRRTDGQPDDCGDLPGTWPSRAPSGATYNTTVNIDLGGGAKDYAVDLSDIKASLDWNKGLIIGGTATIAGMIIALGAELDAALAALGAEVAGLKAVPDIEIDPPGGGQDDPPQPEPEKPVGRLMGLIVHVKQLQPTTRKTLIPTTDCPPIRVPYVGWVQFGMQLNGQYYVFADIPIKRDAQYVPVPGTDGADIFWLHSESGFELTAEPIYATGTGGVLHYKRN